MEGFEEWTGTKVGWGKVGRREEGRLALTPVKLHKSNTLSGRAVVSPATKQVRML